jgi:hypothetical protein
MFSYAPFIATVCYSQKKFGLVCCMQPACVPDVPAAWSPGAGDGFCGSLMAISRLYYWGVGWGGREAYPMRPVWAVMRPSWAGNASEGEHYSPVILAQLVTSPHQAGKQEGQ